MTSFITIRGHYAKKSCKTHLPTAISDLSKKNKKCMSSCARHVPGTTWPCRVRGTARHDLAKTGRQPNHLGSSMAACRARHGAALGLSATCRAGRARQVARPICYPYSWASWLSSNNLCCSFFASTLHWFGWCLVGIAESMIYYYASLSIYSIRICTIGTSSIFGFNILKPLLQ